MSQRTSKQQAKNDSNSYNSTTEMPSGEHGGGGPENPLSIDENDSLTDIGKSTIGGVLGATQNISVDAANSSSESFEKSGENLAKLINSFGYVLQGIRPAEMLKQVGNIMEYTRRFIKDMADVFLNIAYPFMVIALNPDEPMPEQLAANLGLIGFYLILIPFTLGFSSPLVVFHTILFLLITISISFNVLGTYIARIQNKAWDMMVDRK